MEIRPIIDYEGYFISDSGDVYCNLGRGNRNKDITVPMYKIKPRLTTEGYARICARQTSTGKRKDLYIHRLVALYFIPNPENKKYVDHINCIRDDNRKENLRWCTAKENTDRTEEMKHIIRNENGQYISNYDYQKDALNKKQQNN